MPIYLFKCKRCGHTVEKLSASNAGTGETICATCGSMEIDKMATSFLISSGGMGGIFRFI